MNYIVGIILFVMTLGLAVCGFFLWKRRKETGDFSRHIQAVFSWISAAFAAGFCFRTWIGATPINGPFLEPEHIFTPLFIQSLYFLYPLEVIRPAGRVARVYAFLFVPLLALGFIGKYVCLEYTAIHTYADLWSHIGEFNVWFRLFALVVMLFYGFSLFLVPYDLQNSRVSRKFVLRYALGFCLIGVFYFAAQITHHSIFLVLQQLAWMSFFFSIAYYELFKRLAEPLEVSQEVPQEQEDKLWQRIVVLMEENEGWRIPEMTQKYLASELLSNQTYIGEAFKRNTGMTFNKYLTNRRINFVVEQLKENPQANIQQLFRQAGYREYSTAWRNFQKIKGVSPTKFIESANGNSNGPVQ